MRRLIIVGMGLLSRGVSQLAASLAAMPTITFDDLTPDRDSFAYYEPKLHSGAFGPCAWLAQPRPYIRRLKGSV